MEELTFKIISTEKITSGIAENFIGLLKKQNKVKTPTDEKIQSCFRVVLCYADQNLIGIGALKTKTSSDFSTSKADLPDLEPKFTWELGYMYVDENFKNYGISTTITRLLLKQVPNENIMASTEIHNDNPMIYILDKFGFQKFGKPWPSAKHDGTLGLFLKFKKGETNGK